MQQGRLPAPRPGCQAVSVCEERLGWRAFYPASTFDTYAATAKRTARSRMIMTFESVCGWSSTCRVDAQRLRWKPRDRHALENVLCTRQPPHSQGLGRYGQRLACPEVRLPAVVWRGTLTRAGRREAQEEVALLEARGRGRPVGGLHRLLVARCPSAALLRAQQMHRQHRHQQRRER